MMNHQRAVAEKLMDFHRCPHTKRIIESTKHDDKAICSCGRANPQVPTEQCGVHLKKFLRSASVDEFMDQELARRRQLGKD